jgi:hypothetical protein
MVIDEHLAEFDPIAMTISLRRRCAASEASNA